MRGYGNTVGLTRLRVGDGYDRVGSIVLRDRHHIRPGRVCAIGQRHPRWKERWQRR